ncbi:zinc-binding dehydrogenase [Rhodococcus hoagii]|nr:zinc-binding dehydrogenase [Prescottella equi]
MRSRCCRRGSGRSSGAARRWPRPRADPVADVLIDTLGGDALPHLLARVVPGGRAALIGYTSARSSRSTCRTGCSVMCDPARQHDSQDRPPSRARPDMIARLVAGDIRLAVQQFPLDDIADALQLMREGKVAGRAVVVP